MTWVSNGRNHSSEEPLFSIIIATYNAGSTLTAAIDSIIAQGRDDTELLVIDGASTDDTESVIESRQDAITYSISEPDTGIYNAWNKGLRAARGRYIAFVGADDVLLPGALDRYSELIAQNSDAEYLSTRVRYGPAGRIIGKEWAWSSFRRYMTVAHVGSMHRRSLFDRLGTYDESFRIVGDYELMLRAGPSLVATFGSVLTAEMGPGGISSGASTKVFQETLRAKRMHSGLSPLTLGFDNAMARLKYRVRKVLKV